MGSRCLRVPGAPRACSTDPLGSELGEHDSPEAPQLQKPLHEQCGWVRHLGPCPALPLSPRSLGTAEGEARSWQMLGEAAGARSWQCGPGGVEVGAGCPAGSGSPRCPPFTSSLMVCAGSWSASSCPRTPARRPARSSADHRQPAPSSLLSQRSSRNRDPRSSGETEAEWSGEVGIRRGREPAGTWPQGVLGCSIARNSTLERTWHEAVGA